MVHQALFGVYLGLTFAPNHKGMPHPDGTEDFLRKQVLTSRNVRGGWLVDTALGGLNHQIEHHLFPAMPTPNLRKAQPIVQAYCAEIGVPYEVTGLGDSYAQAFRHLHDVGPSCGRVTERPLDQARSALCLSRLCGGRARSRPTPAKPSPRCHVTSSGPGRSARPTRNGGCAAAACAAPAQRHHA